ncbi:30S ribosomal protein S16 [Legionella erythra]|uniref:Small ribosomal subunit protein bS16 n=1 Tax=Legionella erythra TaxID=448 RepID=A0A0W0TWM1_LEGER|nr:30S ribosomal protein S16 [Legionella erythra]KTD00048.1 30S ribosomal protein S16 [Legionella erythra]
MVVIRLSRGGAKKRPFYHMVVTDSRRRRDGNYIERIGYYNPVARGQEIPLHVEMDKLAHWQSVGAQMSDRVSQLIKQHKKSKAAE